MMTELIDVKDLAGLLEVSRQTIYNHMQKNEQELLGHTKKIERTTFLTTEGVNIIKVSLGLIEPPVVIEQDAMDMDDVISELINGIRGNLKEDISELLSEQEKVRSEEIAELKEQNKLLMEKLDNMIEKQEMNEKKSLWQRLIGK